MEVLMLITFSIVLNKYRTMLIVKIEHISMWELVPCIHLQTDLRTNKLVQQIKAGTAME